MSRFKYLGYFLLHPQKYLNGPSYFSTSKQNKFYLFCYQLNHIFRYKGLNDFYWLYGFDVKSKKERDEYVPYLVFRDRRNKLNFSNQFTPAIILRDKDLFCAIAKYYGIPVLDNIGVFEKNYVTYPNGSKDSIENILEKYNDVFIKAIDSECGNGIYHVVNNNGLLSVNNSNKSIKELRDEISKGRYVVQETLKQHPLLNGLYHNSVNTIRLVTVRTDDEIVPFSAELRIGAGGSCVDNLAAGGVAVGINEDGTLKSFGIQKPPYGMITYKHPDTNIKYEGIQIPYYDKLVDLTKRFHSILPNIHSIGWDIAITENGPIIVEGNDNWEISGLQACNGGLKVKFEKYFK